MLPNVQSMQLPLTLQIADGESQYVRRSDCDTIFIVANFQPNKSDPMNAINDEHALMRFEFIEAVSRLAIAKYGKVGAGSPTLLQRSICGRVQLLQHIPLCCSGRPPGQACAWQQVPSMPRRQLWARQPTALHACPAPDSFTAGLPHGMRCLSTLNAHCRVCRPRRRTTSPRPCPS